MNLQKKCLALSAGDVFPERHIMRLKTNKNSYVYMK